MNREYLESQLASLPIVQYEFFPTSELTFSPRVRMVCETDCPRYGSSWACPPAVGTVEECQNRCLSYPSALLLTTMCEVEDITNMDAVLDTREGHENITRQVSRILREMGLDTYPLSTESCAVCETCAYPEACRFPEKMFPCVESHGILVTDIAERLGMGFQMGGNVVTWYSLILYRE